MIVSIFEGVNQGLRSVPAAALIRDSLTKLVLSIDPRFARTSLNTVKFRSPTYDRYKLAILGILPGQPTIKETTAWEKKSPIAPLPMRVTEFRPSCICKHVLVSGYHSAKSVALTIPVRSRFPVRVKSPFRALVPAYSLEI